MKADRSFCIERKKITLYNDIKILMGVNFRTPYLTYFAEIFDFAA